ncbi:carbohydrate-binding protein [Herbaspirillum sp. GCM10030257]|uniref:carbohydrate-binding protein n=1 Tax=Herbaspirillum sp. GCM10030257 TaxID=3273393 RepID=UPI00361FCBAF
MERFYSIRRYAVALLGCCLFALFPIGAQAKIFQAEKYTEYHDLSAGNQGGHYRHDDVDIQATTDVGGGYNVGWIEANESLSYSRVVIPFNGSYDVHLRVASASGARASVNLNSGAVRLGEFKIPATGGGQKWTTVSKTVDLKEGTYTLGVVAVTGGWNFNWIEVEPHDEDTGQAKATVYQHCKYDGRATSLEAGSYKLRDLQALGSRENDISSLRVAPGYEVVLYEHDNFRGRSTVMTGNKSCFVGNGFNDAVSSVIVRRADPNTPPPGGGRDDTGDCGTPWRSARLTHFESYPDPGSEECRKNNGCTWAGQFHGVKGVKSRSWVAANNIIAVHSKDWKALGNKTLNLRQGSKHIKGDVIDLCSDSDCAGCCTRNLGGDGHLIDIEKHTMKRFGTGSGTVEFQVCE